RQGQAAGRHAAGRPPGGDGGVCGEPQRRPAPQARRRDRLADGSRGHRGDLSAPEGSWTDLTRYRHLITDENRKWWTLGAMCFALFKLMLDNTVVNVALPSIERGLGASLSSL